MNVDELITILEKIEDKKLPVCVSDWNEMYKPDMLLKETAIGVFRSDYLIEGVGISTGEHVSIG